MYDAANIIAPKLHAAALPTPEIRDKRMMFHGASILASVGYHESQGPFSGGSFSMVFPIKIIFLLSPSDWQTQTAQETLLK